MIRADDLRAWYASLPPDQRDTMRQQAEAILGIRRRSRTPLEDSPVGSPVPYMGTRREREESRNSQRQEEAMGEKEHRFLVVEDEKGERKELGVLPRGRKSIRW